MKNPSQRMVNCCSIVITCLVGGLNPSEKYESQLG